MNAFIVGAIYFGIKAWYLKEPWILYAIIGGITTGILSWILYTLGAVVLGGVGMILVSLSWIIDSLGLEVPVGPDKQVTIITSVFLFTVLIVSLYLVDKWSGLYWNVEKHAAFKDSESTSQQ
jgi:hypothetical protein